MTDEFDRAKDLFQWNERVFTIMGVWPLQSTYVKFSMWIVYFLIHMTTLYADLFHVFGNLELMVLNLSESTWDVMIISKLLIMRFSRTLANLTQQVVNGADSENFQTREEMEIYLNYNRIAKFFFKLWLTIGVSASIVYCLKPLSYRIQAGLQNESVPFILSYRARYFFEVNDSMTFWIVWTWQTPVMCFSIYQTVSIGYLFSIILHVSGQMAVLTFRINNLQLISTESNEASRNIFSDIVSRHRNILRMIQDINGVFSLLLLEELIIMTVLLALSSYSVLVNFDLADPGELLAFILYASGLLWMIYGYCLAGEYLVNESMNLHEAYYQCQWYEMSSSFKKQMLICMIGSSKSPQLSAGGFYNFSLEGFTSILKTAGGYISLLRTMI
uniref:Odorant receptor n=1 Tax=Campoletis chlorideae TaxID=219166 RepID=A0A346D414_9HYME|nr:odorant receptor [Campoletis chlorideae]